MLLVVAEGSSALRVSAGFNLDHLGEQQCWLTSTAFWCNNKEELWRQCCFVERNTSKEVYKITYVATQFGSSRYNPHLILTGHMPVTRLPGSHHDIPCSHLLEQALLSMLCSFPQMMVSSKPEVLPLWAIRGCNFLAFTFQAGQDDKAFGMSLGSKALDACRCKLGLWHFSPADSLEGFQGSVGITFGNDSYLSLEMDLMVRY